MNQILSTNDRKSDSKNIGKDSGIKKKFYFFKFQFLFSIIFVFGLIMGYIYFQYSLYKAESSSKTLMHNYQISQLYNNNSIQDNNTNFNSSNNDFFVIGIIDIPKLKISYPILSDINEEFLKISPCRISGSLPGEKGNLCIAGHNYDNYKFFSNISSLNTGDKIILYDTNGNKFTYIVFQNYEVNENDLSPLFYSNTDSDLIELTLITCNNVNNNRIIIKAKTESH